MFCSIPGSAEIPREHMSQKFLKYVIPTFLPLENMQSNKQTKLLTVQCVSAVSVCWFILNISHRAALFASAAKASCTCCSYIDYHHAKREGQSSSSTTMAAVERKSNFGFLSFLFSARKIYHIYIYTILVEDLEISIHFVCLCSRRARATNAILLL